MDSPLVFCRECRSSPASIVKLTALPLSFLSDVPSARSREYLGRQVTSSISFDTRRTRSRSFDRSTSFGSFDTPVSLLSPSLPSRPPHPSTNFDWSSLPSSDSLSFPLSSPRLVPSSTRIRSGLSKPPSLPRRQPQVLRLFTMQFDV